MEAPPQPRLSRLAGRLCPQQASGPGDAPPLLRPRASGPPRPQPWSEGAPAAPQLTWGQVGEEQAERQQQKAGHPHGAGGRAAGMPRARGELPGGWLTGCQEPGVTLFIGRGCVTTPALRGAASRVSGTLTQDPRGVNGLPVGWACLSARLQLDRAPGPQASAAGPSGRFRCGFWPGSSAGGSGSSPSSAPWREDSGNPRGKGRGPPSASAGLRTALGAPPARLAPSPLVKARPVALPLTYSAVFTRLRGFSFPCLCPELSP